jgi:hypothetical protein
MLKQKVKDRNFGTKSLVWKVLLPTSITCLTYFRLITFGT